MPNTTHHIRLSRAQSSGRTTERGRLESLFVSDKGDEIRVTEGQLPACLLETNRLVLAGHIKEARAELREDRLEVVERIVTDDPSRTDLMYVLAGLLRDTNQPDRSELWLQRILKQEPHPRVYCDLARFCAQNPLRCGEGLDHAQRALALDPNHVEALSLCAEALASFGRTEQCVAMLDRALELSPGHAVISLKRLWNLRYLPGHDREYFHRQYTQWGQAHLPAAPGSHAWECDPDPDRRLRVGIISPEFRENSPVTAFEAFVELCDRRPFEVYGYGYPEMQNRGTERFASRFDRYLDVWGWPPERIIETLRADRVDILMEIGGHSRRNPLGIMAHGPVPVQVDFGGLDSLGVPQIQYRLTDEILDPPETLVWFSEHSVYLPGGSLFFIPPRESPLVTALPAEQNGYITFGSFNGSPKINAYVKSLWARILQAVPDSRLVLKCPVAGEPRVQAAFKEDFERLGIDPRRISFYGSVTHYQHLEILGQMDMLLDTTPFNGWRTTLEGLWMAVPTVSLVGDQYVSRVGLEAMSGIGLEIFAARTADEYVAKAVAFAGQRDSLAAIRRSLRSLMLSSPLCDPGRWTRDLEGALRAVWIDACARQGQAGDR